MRTNSSTRSILNRSLLTLARNLETHAVHNTVNWTSAATKRRCASYSASYTNYNFTLLPPAVTLIPTPSEILSLPLPGFCAAWLSYWFLVWRVRRLHHAALWIPHPNLLCHFHYPHTDCVLSTRVDSCNKGACASRMFQMFLLFRNSDSCGYLGCMFIAGKRWW